MATNSNPGAKPRATAKKTSARKTAGKASATPAGADTTTTQARSPISQIQHLTERALLIQVGAGLAARDNVVSTVKGLSGKYRDSAAFSRELERYERRGATARTRLEHEMHVTRTRLERDLRQRRSRLERSVRDSRRRFERQVSSVRRDLEKSSERVSRLVGNAQGPISAS